MEEGKLISNLEVGGGSDILAEYMVEVMKFEELVEIGRKFLIRFQQALEFFRCPSYGPLELVKTIIKANETKRANAYVEAGCINACDSAHNANQLYTSLGGLWDCLTKAKGIINELENLMDKAGNALVMNSEDQLAMEFQDSKQEVNASQKLDAAVCASYMAIIYSMVKQDYTMQEKIVSSLNLKSSNSVLESYCLMWMLRPFIDEDVIHQALRLVR